MLLLWKWSFKELLVVEGPKSNPVTRKRKDENS